MDIIKPLEKENRHQAENGQGGVNELQIWEPLNGNATKPRITLKTIYNLFKSLKIDQ